MPLSGGQTFAGYRVVRLLGSGGMGEVYLAEHPRLPRRDALKVLPADVSADPDYRARFEREADLASKLWHPNIVAVHDRGEYEGQLWISMDYIAGTNAADLLAHRFPDGLPVGEVLKIVTAVASALDYAHKQGLLHRDVKPANIMVAHAEENGEQRILLSDFGIARNVGEISGLTHTNMTVGTVAYCAPEQLMGLDIDGRADEYALGSTAYQLLTGSQLFPHSNPAVVISHHLNSPPPALADTRPDLAALDPVLARALAKDPDDRFSRCSDFARALAEPSVAATKLAPVPPTPRPGVVQGSPASQPPRGPAASGTQRRWLVPGAVLAVIVLASVIALAWHPWDREKHAPSTANSPAPAINSSQGSSVPHPPSASPPPPPMFPTKAIDTVLLTSDEVNSILGTYITPPSGDRIALMKVDRSSSEMTDHSNLVKPPGCVGVVFGAEHEVYADTAFNAVRDQTFIEKPEFSEVAPNGFPPPVIEQTVEQTVIVFPSADQAQGVIASAQKQWQLCATTEVDQVVGEELGYPWTLGSVERQGDLLTVPMATHLVIGTITGTRACQQVLGVRENVIVGSRSCNDIEQSVDMVTKMPADPNWATNHAARMATAMLDKVKV